MYNVSGFNESKISFTKVNVPMRDIDIISLSKNLPQTDLFWKYDS